jgi:hypothetical protein
MLFLIFTLFCQDVKKADDNTTVLPFLKVETIGVSPFDEREKIFYKKSAGDKIVKEFKEAPVFILKYEMNGNKTISKFEQVGMASCVFFTQDNWIAASINLKTPIPEGYVLRAHTVAKKNEIKLDRTLEVSDASIIQFYLKPKDESVKFK